MAHLILIVDTRAANQRRNHAGFSLGEGPSRTVPAGVGGGFCHDPCGQLRRQRQPGPAAGGPATADSRSEEHTSELQSLMRISYAVFCLKQKKTKNARIK